MKLKKLFSFLLMSFALMQMANAEAYVLEVSGEKTLKTTAEKEYALSGEPGFLTFQARKREFWGVAEGPLRVAQKVGGNWKEFFKQDMSFDYASFGPFKLDRNATHIKFETKAGNLGYKDFKNVKVTMASYLEVDKSSIELPETEIGKNLTASFTVKHSNIATLTVTSSNPDVWTPNITTISESGLGKHGSKLITVTLSANKAREYKGKITISNGKETAAVSLSCVVNKKTQTITWAANSSMIPEGEELSNIATASSGLDISYTSNNTDIINVVDGKLVAVAEGTANITALQAGDDTWHSASATKDISVTRREIQTITWTQDLYRLVMGGEAVTLNATTNSELPITYSSANTSVVSVEGNTLTIVGTGETSITASQAGNDTWAPATYEIPVRVREISDNCDEYVIYDFASHELMTSGSKGKSKTYILNAPADKLSYDVWINSSLAIGGIKLKEYYADGSSKQLKEGRDNVRDLQVSRNAVKLEFYVNDGTLKKGVKNITLTQATYLETDVPSIDFGDIEVETTVNKTLTVSYSNLTDIVEVANTNNNFTLSDNLSFGTGCGDHGSQNIEISVSPDTQGEMTDEIVIVSADKTLTIPVTINVVRKVQAIEWTQDFSTTKITDTLELTASSSSKLPVTYTSSNTEVAVVSEGKLTFLAAGTTEITASQEGNETYAPAQSMTKPVTVEQIASAVTTAPTASDITYGQTLAEAVLSNGVADVEGTFAWADTTLAPNAGEAQTFSVIFTPENASYYTTATLDVAVNVAKAAQSITWNNDLSTAQITDVIDLNATASSGLDVAFSSSDESVAVINDGKLTFLAAGVADITASQAGNDNYSAAEDVIKTITVNVVTPTITTAPTASDITYGQTLAEAVLSNGVADVEGTFAWADTTLAPNAGEAQTFSVIFTPNNAEYYTTTTLDVTVNVAKAAQTITWDDDLSETQITDRPNLAASSSSNLPITYTLSDESVAIIFEGQLYFIKAGTVQITASQAGNDNYSAAEDVIKTITVNVVTPTITTAPTASDITYGQTLAEAVLSNGVADVEGTFAWADTTLAPNAGEAQTFSVIFTPNNTDYYTTTTLDVTVNVAKAAQSITWEQDLSTTLQINDELELMASASSGLDVAFTSSDESVAVIENGILKILANGTCTITASQAGDDNYLSATDTAQVVTVSTATATENIVTRKFTVYPNPVADLLTVHTENDDLLVIYDQQGRMVKHIQATGNILNVNVANLITGKYIVTLISNKTKERISTIVIKE